MTLSNTERYAIIASLTVPNASQALTRTDRIHLIGLCLDYPEAGFGKILPQELAKEALELHEDGDLTLSNEEIFQLTLAAANLPELHQFMFKNVVKKTNKGGSSSPSGGVDTPQNFKIPQKPKYVASEQPELYAFDNPYEKQTQNKKSRG